jgi:hypothetical protein
MRRQLCIKRVPRAESIVRKVQKELLIIVVLRMHLILSILLEGLEQAFHLIRVDKYYKENRKNDVIE